MDKQVVNVPEASALAQPRTRKDFFKSLAVAGLGAAAGASALTSRASAQGAGGDVEIANFALTLEYLETQGVPVIGYGCEELPAFYTRESGFKVDYRLDSAEDIAKALRLKWELGLSGGVVVANPIPEPYAMPKADIDDVIHQALQEAEERGIKGKAATPFLLARVCELTGGESLASNIRLVLNNAELGARIAVAMAAA